MIAVSQKLRAGLPDTKMILQVHDELIFDVPSRDLEEATQLVKTEMEAVGPRLELSVPLKVDVATGSTWRAAHPSWGPGVMRPLASAPLAGSQPRRSAAETFRYSLPPLSDDKGARGQYRLSSSGRRAGPSRSGDVRSRPHDTWQGGRSRATVGPPLLRQRSVQCLPPPSEANECEDARHHGCRTASARLRNWRHHMASPRWRSSSPRSPLRGPRLLAKCGA